MMNKYVPVFMYSLICVDIVCCLFTYSFINLYIWVVFARTHARKQGRSGFVFESCHRKSGGAATNRIRWHEFVDFQEENSKRRTSLTSSSSSWVGLELLMPAETRSRSQESSSLGQFILVSINKHYLKHLSGPVRYPRCGSVASPTQGIEYLIIALTE